MEQLEGSCDSCFGFEACRPRVQQQGKEVTESIHSCNMCLGDCQRLVEYSFVCRTGTADFNSHIQVLFIRFVD